MGSNRLYSPDPPLAKGTSTASFFLLEGVSHVYTLEDSSMLEVLRKQNARSGFHRGVYHQGIPERDPLRTRKIDGL